MVALCLTFLIAVGGPRAVGPIPVAVFASADAGDSLVGRICAEADAIWKPAGIAFEWRRVSVKDETDAWVGVTIDDLRAGHEPDRALGWITFTADGPGRSIHLSRASAERLLAGVPELNHGTQALHETLVGRALGRALAHELGHYLLQSKSHTPRGLMRAVWTAEESFRAWRGGFELTPEQRATAAHELQMKSACAESAQECRRVDQAFTGYPQF